MRRRTDRLRLHEDRLRAVFSFLAALGAPPPAVSALDGLVSKRSDRPNRGGRSRDWIKVKNRQHQSFDRVKEAFA